MNDLEKVLVEDSPEKQAKPTKPLQVVRKWKYRMVVAAFLAVVVLMGVAVIFMNANHSAKEKYKDKIITLETDIDNLKKSNKEEIDKLNQAHKAKVEQLKNTIDEKEKIINKYKNEPKVSLVVPSDLESEIKKVGKLVTLEYLYDNAGKFEDGNIITKKSFIAQWEGKAEIGLDMAKVKVAVNEGSKTITITLPRAGVISMDNGKAKTLDENNNIFNPISVGEVLEFEMNSKDALRAKIEQSEVLNQAYNNATVILENFINLMPGIKGQYKIAFQQAK